MVTALKVIRFFVNGHKVETTESELTGAQIKALGGCRAVRPCFSSTATPTTRLPTIRSSRCATA